MKGGSFKRKPYAEIIAKKTEATKRAIAKKKAKMSEVSSKPRKTAQKPKSGSKGTKKRKGKTERQKLEEKLWDECKRIIRKRHGNTCYTCGATGLEGSNWQTGHGKPKGALPIEFKYDLRNLRPQCMRDNLHYGGLSDLFITKLEKEEEGLEFLNDACRLTEEGWIIKKESKYTGMMATQFLKDLLEKYKTL